jgi:hypothetical protein
MALFAAGVLLVIPALRELAGFATSRARFALAVGPSSAPPRVRARCRVHRDDPVRLARRLDSQRFLLPGVRLPARERRARAPDAPARNAVAIRDSAHVITAAAGGSNATGAAGSGQSRVLWPSYTFDAAPTRTRRSVQTRFACRLESKKHRYLPAFRPAASYARSPRKSVAVQLPDSGWIRTSSRCCANQAFMSASVANSL